MSYWVPKILQVEYCVVSKLNKDLGFWNHSLLCQCPKSSPNKRNTLVHAWNEKEVFPTTSYKPDRNSFLFFEILSARVEEVKIAHWYLRFLIRPHGELKKGRKWKNLNCKNRQKKKTQPLKRFPNLLVFLLLLLLLLCISGGAFQRVDGLCLWNPKRTKKCKEKKDYPERQVGVIGRRVYEALVAAVSNK